VKLADDHANLTIRDNGICTSKYTKWTFGPKNFLEQFINKKSNLYFLAIMFMQSIKSISITNGKMAMATPLCIVLFTSMLNDGYEDYKRH